MEIKDLRFSYGNNEILKGISLEIKENKITTILGANGCGKSTLFNLMTKNLVPKKGEIILDGVNIKDIKLKNFAKKVAIVHQYNTAPSDITVEKLIKYGRIPHFSHHGRDKDGADKVKWAMDITGLTEFKDRRISDLSGGQKQRVWIAMALAQDTKILFLDEPTTYLDIRYQIDILKLVKKLNEEFGITIIMILHEINQAIHYSDELIGLKDGNVIFKGKPEDVITEKAISELYSTKLAISDFENKKFVLTV